MEFSNNLDVDIQDGGVELNQVERGRKIFLSKNTWLNLAECGPHVEKALEENREYMCTINEVKDIRVHLTPFNGIMYVHVRVWWQGRPTRKGITLLGENWNQLASHLTRSPETVLGVAVMKRMMKERLAAALCKPSEVLMDIWSSQVPEMSAELAMLHVEVPKPREFILQLAEEACKSPELPQTDVSEQAMLACAGVIDDQAAQAKEAQEVILERPHQTYKRVLLFHMPSIKSSVLADYQ